ncbi:hypothetical protein WA026_008271 [Henosepilachna vigintioctopunctata]|uniref:Endonuclease/exonuclease/phosphatase domain-containing protein n=1 Tax=Henosepilachna vigintioctopunctata TaxID=420089 RepID=A0AAW1TQS3_9CUCU
MDIYRPPRDNTMQFMDDLDNVTSSQKKKKKNDFILIGDINIDLLKNTNTPETYINCITSNAFQVQNKITPESSTRTTETIISILVNIITNNNITADMFLEDHVISDHKIIFINIKKQIYQSEKIVCKKQRLNEILWRQTIQEKLSNQEIYSFKELKNIINTSKLECTTKYTYKINLKN